jgi:hypothetical protein
MVLLVAARICMAQATVPWLTRSADNSRSGWNPRETQLTQAAVQAKGIIRADIVPIVDDLRVGENAQLHKSAVSSKGVLTYVAQSHEYASADVRGEPPGGMPGGFCSGSSNGANPNSAILVCTIPYGDATRRS